MCFMCHDNTLPQTFANPLTLNIRKDLVKAKNIPIICVAQKIFTKTRIYIYFFKCEIKCKIASVACKDGMASSEAAVQRCC